MACKIIGGGEEGDKSIVCTKEDADDSLPYLIAVAVLDNPGNRCEYAAFDRMHVLHKFNTLTSGRMTRDDNRQLVDAIRHLDTIRVADLMQLLAGVGHGDRRPRYVNG